MTLELSCTEASILYKYLRAADKYYEEMENCGEELTNDMECHVISGIEEQISDYFGGLNY